MGEGKINVDQWGKVNPEWEETPFRPMNALPEVTEEVASARYRNMDDDPAHTYEKTRMIPSKNWYAGQTGIDRAQVERVKKFGPNNPAEAAGSPPHAFIDENGNYQVYQGHHRMTAAMEEGKPVDMILEDVQPRESWMRKTRGMKGEQSPFAVKGKQAASGFREEMEASSDKPRLSARQRLMDETGSCRSRNRTFDEGACSERSRSRSC